VINEGRKVYDGDVKDLDQGRGLTEAFHDLTASEA
jgi:hypothetical protein